MSDYFESDIDRMSEDDLSALEDQDIQEGGMVMIRLPWDLCILRICSG